MIAQKRKHARRDREQRRVKTATSEATHLDADGTPIILWPCVGAPNERWHMEGRRIVGLGGKCLNVAGGGDA